jgi:FOG: WD40 repeat
MHPRLPARLLISPTVLGGEIRALTAAFVRQQSLVACGTSAHAVAVFDGDTGDLMWRDSDRYTDPLSTIAIEAGVDRGRIFTGGVGGDIAVHDLFTGKHPAEPLHRHGVEIRDLVVVQGPGGSSVIVFCAVDGTVGVVHAETGQQLLTWRVEEEVLNSVDANVEQDDLVIVVGSASGRVICRTLPLKLLESTGLVRLTGDDGDVTDIARHELAVNCVRFMGTGEQLQVLSASTDTTWRLTNVADARGRPGVGHVGPVWSIDAVSVEGRTYVYTAGGEGTCRLWLIESVEEDLEFARSARHHGPVTSIFLLPGDVHGRVTALTGGGDGGVRITTSAKAAGSRTVLHHGAEISAVMCVPSSDRSDSLDVISGSTDGALHLTELGEEGYSASQVLGIVHEGVTTLSKGMIGGSQHVISGGLDGTISIWDLDKRAPKATVRACQYGSVQALCHVDARGEGAVVAGGQDGTLSLRVGIALEERRCSRLPTSILCLSAFPGSGMWFVAGLTDGRLAIVRELGPHAENIQYVEASETEIRGVAAMLIGDRLVVAATGLDRRLRLFDATSGTEMLQIELDGYALTLAANETRIALGTTAGAMVATFPVDPLLLTMPT